jgi:hypothetical protein
MVSHKHFVANLWRWSAGVPEVDYAPIAHDAQWSPEFERLMRNRLIVGAYRYGSLSATCKPSYDRVESCLKRLAQYRETGNLELLVDVANLCLLEFVESKHPNRHFHSVDDGEHVTAA